MRLHAVVKSDRCEEDAEVEHDERSDDDEDEDVVLLDKEESKEFEKTCVVLVDTFASMRLCCHDANDDCTGRCQRLSSKLRWYIFLPF